jgi:CDP-L-myo-inositol myo-inositolphosphotransferase
MQRLRQSGQAIVRNTAKPSDGIVSRYLNRSISTRISLILLKSRHVRPIHATAAAILTALVMFGCLASGTHSGLITGAILFQVASVIDGIDGEIARATFRESRLGATLDSLADAATNLAFLLGLGISLTQQGAVNALAIGLAGFAGMGIGLVLLGGHAAISGRAVNFDALKQVVRRQHTVMGNWLIWLTMRDFLALASALMVLLGFGYHFLKVFAFGSLIWLLAATVFVVHDTFAFRRKRNRKPRSDRPTDMAP